MLRRAGARQRHAAGQARGQPVLRRGRRPGVRRAAGGDRRRHARAWPTCCAWAATRRWRSSRSRASSVEGERGPRGGRARRAPGHDAQPHRHAPAARGAARAPGHPRPPGRLLRGPRQAALRLHPRRAPVRGRPARGRGARERLDRRQPPGARDRDQPRRGQAAGRHGPVRREVRRLGAHGRGRGRLARALRRHPRGRHRRGRPLPHHERDFERVERAPHRGRDRPRGHASCSSGGPRCCASCRARSRCPRAELAQRRRAAGRARQGAADSAPPGEDGGAAAEALVGRRRGDRRACRVVTARVGRRATPRRCWLCPTACARSSATPRWCSGAAADGRVHLVANVAPAADRARPEGRRRDQAPPPRWPAAAGAAATRWPRPAAAIPRSSTTPSPRPGPRSRPRFR